MCADVDMHGHGITYPVVRICAEPYSVSDILSHFVGCHHTFAALRPSSVPFTTTESRWPIYSLTFSSMHLILVAQSVRTCSQRSAVRYRHRPPITSTLRICGFTGKRNAFVHIACAQTFISAGGDGGGGGVGDAKIENFAFRSEYFPGSAKIAMRSGSVCTRFGSGSNVE